MSYRIQIDLDERAPLEEKVLLHAKFLRHLQRRKLEADARGRTNWAMEFFSHRTGFTIMWNRQPRVPGRACRFHMEHLIGWVIIRFSLKDVEIGGPLLISGDWAAIEAQQKEKVS